MALTLTNDILKFRESTSDPWEKLLIQANMNFNLIYPVGSIYMSTVNVDPGTIFGGTWEQLKDTFLLGAGDSYTAGDTGGEATHTLTVDEMPSHGHGISAYHGGLGDGNVTQRGWAGSTDSKVINSVNTGGGQAHNNMPPYIVVYMWKRLTLSPTIYTPPVSVLIGEVASEDIVPIAKGGTGADNVADARTNLGLGGEAFDLTTSLSGFQGHGIFDKATNTVRIFCSGSYASNVSASTTLFNVPSEYRPSTTIYGVFMCMTSSGYTSGNLYVEANGDVSQGQTNVLRTIIGFAEYKLS